MKWVYLPTMLALAFVYTKISYSDFAMPRLAADLPAERRPASVVEVVTKKTLPKMKMDIFYKRLEAENLVMFDRVSFYKGMLIGNPNLESFGIIIDDAKKANFGIVDFNEIAQGRFYHDILAHLVLSRSLDNTISWLDYFEAYKKGLTGQAHAYSFYVDKGMNAALFDSEKIIEENITKDFPFGFIKIKRSHHLETVEKNYIKNGFMKIFPKIQFFDIRGSDSTTKQYQILARLRPQDKIQWLSMKEVKKSSYDQVFNPSDIFPMAKRFELIKNNVYSHKMDRSLQGLEIDKKFFTIKFAEQFLSSLDFEQIPSEDYHDIIMDQAYAIGEVHRNTLGEHTSDYIKGWAGIPVSMVDKKVIELQEKMKDIPEGL